MDCRKTSNAARSTGSVQASYAGYTFDDRARGQLGITVRKATAVAHGSDTGWSAAYGRRAGGVWTAAIQASHYTLDGGEPNGLKTVGQMGTEATVQIDGSHIVLRRVEIDGGSQKAQRQANRGRL